MKHIFSSITVLFILLTSSACWGSVDGKGIYCTLNKSLWHTHTRDTLAFLFRDGTVRDYYIRRKGDEYSIGKTWKPQRYISNVNLIKWNFPFDDFFLNRKTLKLEIKDENTGDSYQTILLKAIYDCEVFSNVNKLKKRLNIEVKRLQKIYDEKRSDNKI